MPKFFVQSDQITGNNIQILGDNVNHIHNVLRKNIGDVIQVCNKDTGENYVTKIIDLQKNYITCEIEEEINKTVESNVNITIFQGVPKFDKMEQIIQKNTEIGARKIVPVMMDRTIVKLNEKDKAKKIERWRKIAEIAAKQSMRDIIPEITEPIKTKEIISYADTFDIMIVAYENEQNISLKSVLKSLKHQDNYKIGIVIGPEGGISDEEIQSFMEANFSIVTLGKRILRTETAALVMSSNIIYELEEGE